MKCRHSKLFDITSLILIFVFICNNHENTVSSLKLSVGKQELELHTRVVREYFSKRKEWVTSNLGSIMFKNADPRLFVRKHTTRNLLVSVRRFNLEETIRFFRPSNDPLDGCSVKNCIFSDNSFNRDKADAIVIIIRNGLEFIPAMEKRDPKQIWILFSEESPIHTITDIRHPNLQDISNIFNWTMTFRSDSDIPVPYGRTIALPMPVDVDTKYVEAALRKLVPFWEEKQFSVMSTIMMSNCKVPRRNTMLAKLRQYMKVDVNGRCFYSGHGSRCKNLVSAELRPDCNHTKRYIFYLAFENSSCRQYLTEKCYYNAYAKGAIPVIIGPPIEDCKKLLPPNSFLHMDSYKTPRDLVNHMVDIFQQWDILLSFHAWRKHFAVVNEHGYFNTKSRYYCRVCEALNYNDGEVKIYDVDELRLYLDQKLLCDESYNKM